jgi:hypothetical protein
MDDFLEARVVPLCCLCLCCCATVFGVIALPLSYKSLEQGRYALELSWTTQKIADGVLSEPGIYLVGLGNMLVEYPSTYQTMYFVRDSRGITDTEDMPEVHHDIKKGPIYTRSKDGLEMVVSASFQYQMQPNSLHPLYDILGGGELEDAYYRAEFVRFARAAIVESCANFGAAEFFVNRSYITQNMLYYVRKAFERPDIGLGLTITGLQLREVDLPDAFDRELVRTQEELQETLVAYAERQEQQIIMSKNLMVAQEELKQTEQEALGIAGKTLVENEAIVKQILIYAKKQAESNQEVLAQFVNDSDPYRRLFEVMEMRALVAHNKSKMLMNL